MRDRRTLGAWAVLLPLLAALLSQGLAPHLHVSAASGHQLEAPVDAASEPRSISSAECVACRSGNQLRAGLVSPGSIAVFPHAASAVRLGGRHDDAVATRIVRVSAPPRAPPV